jgi:hydroxymethylpyrimidine/phosphomethylpyrimidine kinase
MFLFSVAHVYVAHSMLYNSAIVRVVADKLRKYNVLRLVVDPVLVAKTGGKLLEEQVNWRALVLKQATIARDM